MRLRTVMIASARSSNSSPTIRSQASSAISFSGANTPALIHSSRRRRMVVAEQVLSAIPW